MSVLAETKPLVLIVDDQPTNVQVLAEILGDEVRVMFALDGEQCLERVAQHAFDLILLDISLPGIDGFEVCTRLKQSPATAGVPVIFVSSRSEESDEERGFALGAMDYVHKPFLPSIVKARVRTHLRLRQLLQELAVVANLDGLTRLPNRRALDERLNAERERALAQGTPWSLLVVDLDHFKQFNDRFGHAAGDEVLRLAAGCVRENITREDFAGRWGGEEFLVLTPQPLDGAAQLANRLCKAVAALKSPYGNIHCSIGVAQFSAGEPVHGLFARADNAVYEAKARGRNQVVTTSLAAAL